MTTNGNDPLVDLWAEQNRLVALGRAADIDDPEIDQAGDKLSAIEGRIANTEARTLAGVVVQIKVHGDVLKDSGAWNHTVKGVEWDRQARCNDVDGNKGWVGRRHERQGDFLQY